MMAPLGRWTFLSDEPALTTPVFTVVERRCLSPKDGAQKRFTCLLAPEWVNVLALTPDGQALLVRQYRHGSGEESLELPGGVVEPGQTLLEAARRELMEETGYAAPLMEPLCSLRPNPAIMGNRIHTFLALGAERAGPTAFDENEELDPVLVPEAELKDLILDGRIDHAMMVAAIGYHLAAKR
jgi:8-oxo-dGTP pyrophosphatase MutT (NUDIX family)